MLKLSQWAKIDPEKFEKLFLVPTDVTNQDLHFQRLNEIYDQELHDLLDTWNSLSEAQWETTRVIGRDMPEWAELSAKLVTFRQALMGVKKFPKKIKPVVQCVADGNGNAGEEYEQANVEEFSEQSSN